MNNGNSDVFERMFFTLLGSVIGACFSFGAGYWLITHKRQRDAKDAFLVFISHKRMNIDKGQVAEYHRKTKSEVRDAVSRLMPFLKQNKAARLEDVWIRYDGLQGHSDLNQHNENEWVQSLYEYIPDAMEKPPRKPSDILKSFFGEFSNMAR